MSRATPILLGVFFALATLILVSVSTALFFPGTAAEIVWKAYEARRAMLMPYRVWLAPGFLALAMAMASASSGCFSRRSWGRHLAIAIFAVNGAGDVVQLALGNIVEGAIGVVAAGLLIFWLSRTSVKEAFA